MQAQQPLVLPAPEAPPPAEISHHALDLPSVFPTKADASSFTGSDLSAVAMDTASIATAPVKEERRRSYDSEETHMEAEPRGEELDISLDLISDLITEEAGPAEAPPPPAVSGPAVFPTWVRYVVPPQPSPSSSFLPFPHPLPSSSSRRLASITDFSPEWSYPEVRPGSEPSEPGTHFSF